MWLVTGVIIAVALLVIVGLVVVSGGFEDDKLPAVSMPEVPPPAAELRVGRSLGDPSAPVQDRRLRGPPVPGLRALHGSGSSPS